ncbi:hypothetical protein, partial [Nocardiopsis metallicus]|uniref:hypothetical protein n=1 Tax=Nocardiopsis metallicus TaxID=179819 RepID=UPI0031E00923
MAPDRLDQTELELLDAYWRAANYLSVGQIYLLDNPLLRQPLQPEHIKPRLLGHWGTTPGVCQVKGVTVVLGQRRVAVNRPS